MTSTSLPSFADPDIQKCPFPFYDRLRDEQPVFHDPQTGHYVLTRYDDVRKALLSPSVLSNKTPFLGDRWTPEANALFEKHGWLPMDTLVSNDQPEHRTYRTLVDKVFTPAKVKGLEPVIIEMIDELLDSLSDREEIDFLEAFAIPLPMFVIADQLGVRREDRVMFKHWSNVAVETTGPLTPERQLELAQVLIELQQYMAIEIERVRTKPDDMLISRLVNLETDGRRLNDRELHSIVFQILVAGNETTTTTLASGMRLMIERPELAASIHADFSLAKALVEETLRTATPLQCLWRTALADVVFGDMTIPAGSIVEMRFGAANRDPAQFGCPSDVDLERKNANSHLAFGAGIHLCIGNQLARGELRLAFQALTQRLTNFRFSRGDASCRPLEGYTPYGLQELWMSFDRR
ncbi:cytochrome P450 [Sphingobium sp. CR2-8]|uniref:cytochrome P450 n=1 Tax=Sphingobium sp. CR2-8 TaxID=1306534 RepID=UPI002DC02C79|nr:cytochrome P450 [Sphingobium sp. CR2-8]MEC3909140.1 cytochrome P450 [Sphingobium sp. CR2-8]